MPIRKTLLASGALLALFASQTMADTTLRLSTQMPPSHHSVKALETFKSEVEDATDGSLKVQIHPAGQLFKGPDLPMAVGSGAVDMGDMVTPYVAPIYPDLALLDGPFMVDSPEVARRLYEQDLKQVLDDRFGRLGMKVVAVHPYGYFSMYGTNARPIETPADMKGLSIRAVDKTQILKAQAVGAKPEAIPGSEQFMAYQRGTVDVGQTGPSSFVSRKLYEIFEHGAIIRDDLMVFFLTINKGVWEGLTPEEQAAVEAAGQKLSDTSWDLMLEEEKAADEFLPQHMKVVFVDHDDLQPWRDAFSGVNAKLAEDAGERGKEIFDIIVRVRTELGAD
ncbi:TRAP transporter substrate-binding protein DctP [Pikeienuella sp. HZG-20]|uniref:TRAP transporter substrate-binding protein n=1 Tax=Paludibacillus litoralis TaxID=3133267 RepID=UPI0030EB2EF2